VTVLFVDGFDQYTSGALVLHFPRHKLYRCPPECEGCYVCRGGLTSCVRCGGAEASLPTDCPGHQIDHGTQDDIAAGLVDYRWREGGWVRRT